MLVDLSHYLKATCKSTFYNRIFLNEETFDLKLLIHSIDASFKRSKIKQMNNDQEKAFPLSQLSSLCNQMIFFDMSIDCQILYFCENEIISSQIDKV